MPGSRIHPSSFRDPSGFIFSRGGTLFRQVNRSFSATYDQLISSGLYDELVSRELLIPHEEVDAAPATDEAYKVLRPTPVPFVSYPYEWSFTMLKDAALATLRIQQIAMEHGMSLRDASAYNIQFVRARPTLIDTLSFEPIVEGRPWVAYRQFCQHFLAPLALMAYRDVRLGQLSRAHLDGVPLDLAARLLPRRTRLRPGLAMHVHFQARMSAKHADGSNTSGRTFGIRAFSGLVDNLLASVRRMKLPKSGSSWRGYYQDCDHYSREAFEHKQVLVTKFLEELSPATVWDLGANTGMFSRIAANQGARVISLESDPLCVDESYRQVSAERLELLPLVVDLANPSPSMGWHHQERDSLVARGPADCAMALAVIHHLAIAGNVPLQRIASFFSSIARSLIIEFVPKSDEKVKVLLATRDDVFPAYTREGFEHAFAQEFSIDRSEPLIGSDRTLYLMRRAR